MFKRCSLFKQTELIVQSFSVFSKDALINFSKSSLVLHCCYFFLSLQHTAEICSCPNSIKAQLFHFTAHYSVFSSSEQLDGTEVVWLTGGRCDQRHSSSHGSDGTRGQSAKGSELEGGKDDDGQSGRLPGRSDKLQQGEHPRDLPQSHSTIPSGELLTLVSTDVSTDEDQFIHSIKHLLLSEINTEDLNLAGGVTLQFVRLPNDGQKKNLLANKR